MTERIWVTGFPESGYQTVCDTLAHHPDVQLMPGGVLSHEALQGLASADGASPDLEAELRLMAPISAHAVPMEVGECALHKLPLLLQVFPQSAAVVCLRDARDVAVDVAERYGDDFFIGRPTRRVTKLMSEPLSRVGRALLAQADEYTTLRWADITLVRYGQLRDDPDAAIEGLCRTLGLRPSALPCPALRPAQWEAIEYDDKKLAQMLPLPLR